MGVFADSSIPELLFGFPGLTLCPCLFWMITGSLTARPWPVGEDFTWLMSWPSSAPRFFFLSDNSKSWMRLGRVTKSLCTQDTNIVLLNSSSRQCLLSALLALIKK